MSEQINQLNKQLMEEKEKQREKTILSRRKDKLLRDLNVLQNKEIQLKQRLNDEQVDVDKLERVSLTALFLTLAGKKENQLEQEKKEVLEAQLKWQEAKESVEDVENEIATLSRRIHTLGHPEKEYQQILEQKQLYLLSHKDEEGTHAFELSEQIADLRADIKEIDEALDAGNAALRALQSARESLNSAENWGTLDMFGGGMITTAIKHSRIDDAKGEIHRAQSLLRRFANELDDIGETFTVDIGISGGLTFADYFFDGLIMDWFVQGKIQESSNQVDQMYRETSQAVQKLRELQTKAKQTVGSLELEWKQLLESATLDN